MVEGVDDKEHELAERDNVLSFPKHKKTDYKPYQLHIDSKGHRHPFYFHLVLKTGFMEPGKYQLCEGFASHPDGQMIKYRLLTGQQVTITGQHLQELWESLTLHKVTQVFEYSKNLYHEPQENSPIIESIKIE